MFKHNTKKDASGQIFSGIFPIEKARGETLSDLLKRFRLENNLSEDIPLTYAGRLDPMADGMVIILAGDARFQKDKMLGLEKVYEMEILLGVSTDSQDTLGLVEKHPPAGGFENITESKIRDVIGQIKDISVLPYPIYSSRPVNGKPLFSYARAGEEVELPEKKVKIFEVELLSIQSLALDKLVKSILEDIDKVNGDFRQEDIKKSWKEISNDKEVTLVKVRTKVSSGTYMRSLAKWVGGKLGVPALAYSISRKKIGEFES